MVSPKASSEDLPSLYHQQHLQPVKSSGISYKKFGLIGLIFAGGLFLLANSNSRIQARLYPTGFLFGASESLLDNWATTEEAIAYEQIFQNLGGGARAKDAALGAVIASPSTEEPDYYYQWVRDAAIIYKVIIGQFIQGNSSLGPLVRQWVRSQDAIQRTQNPSGQYGSGGIGEPKFLVDNAPYQGSWGRPQDDGPAIRATALIAYAKHLMAVKDDPELLDLLYSTALPADSVIKVDLEYVSHHWQQDSFDLWEEVKGFHFFTLIVQLRCMLEGAEFAKVMGDYGAVSWYAEQAQAMTLKLDDFWSEDGWMLSTLVRDPARPRSGIDCGTILGSLHGQSPLQQAYAPDSERMLSTHYHYVQSMKDTYQINNRPDIPGVACGRYPEDVYDGYHKSLGNPWYLCTTAAAEQMYVAADSLDAAKSINVTAISLAFFQQFVPEAKAGTTYAANAEDYTTILKGMRELGDSFMSTVRHFAQANGSLSEQFNRDTGDYQGARDLTWSYGAFITANQARSGRSVF